MRISQEMSEEQTFNITSHACTGEIFRQKEMALYLPTAVGGIDKRSDSSDI